MAGSLPPRCLWPARDGTGRRSRMPTPRGSPRTSSATWSWSSTGGHAATGGSGRCSRRTSTTGTAHLARMTDFWSAALLRTGRYSGRPVERHRSIEGSATDISTAGSSCSRPRCVTSASPAGRGVPRPRPADAGRDDHGPGAGRLSRGRARSRRLRDRSRYAHHHGRNERDERHERRISNDRG